VLVPALRVGALVLELVELERRLHREHVERDQQEHRRRGDRGQAGNDPAGPTPLIQDAT
jgi:hypothetical protein